MIKVKLTYYPTELKVLAAVNGYMLVDCPDGEDWVHKDNKDVEYIIETGKE